MALPGEVNHAIGRAYQSTFIAALQAHIPAFDNVFTAEREPEKTSFNARSGRSFSFDFLGNYYDPIRYHQVFGESKGYRKANDLLNEYKLFLAKAFVASTDYPSHRSDLFWFVTNVPFACSEGSDIRGLSFLKKTLTDGKNSEVREIVGDGHIDDLRLNELAGNIGVFILTDSYLTRTELSYKVAPGDSIWSILKLLHGGTVPPTFSVIKNQIANANQLESPDKIRAGTRLRIPWCGLSVAPNAPEVPESA